MTRRRGPTVRSVAGVESVRRSGRSCDPTLREGTPRLEVGRPAPGASSPRRLVASSPGTAVRPACGAGSRRPSTDGATARRKIGLSCAAVRWIAVGSVAGSCRPVPATAAGRSPNRKLPGAPLARWTRSGTWAEDVGTAPAPARVRIDDVEWRLGSFETAQGNAAPVENVFGALPASAHRGPVPEAEVAAASVAPVLPVGHLPEAARVRPIAPAAARRTRGRLPDSGIAPPPAGVLVRPRTGRPRSSFARVGSLVTPGVPAVAPGSSSRRTWADQAVDVAVDATGPAGFAVVPSPSGLRRVSAR